MSRIINLTQYPATPEQTADGVFDPNTSDCAALAELFDFNGASSTIELMRRVQAIADIAGRYNCDEAIFGKVPYFWHPLQKAITRKGIMPPIF